MSRTYVDPPLSERCMATITLHDGSTAQCGRRAATNGRCWQHPDATPTPATPTPPSSPPRAGEPTHYCATCWEFYAVEPTAVTLACPKCGARLVPRSPAPASGAPDEEVTGGAAEAIASEIDRLARDVPVGESFNGGGMHGAAVYDCMRYAAELVRQIGRRSPDVSAEAVEIEALRTRLAASERAGEAMREALNGIAAAQLEESFYHGGETYYALSERMRRAARAVLTPTSPAPSPEN